MELVTLKSFESINYLKLKVLCFISCLLFDSELLEVCLDEKWCRCQRAGEIRPQSTTESPSSWLLWFKFFSGCNMKTFHWKMVVFELLLSWTTPLVILECWANFVLSLIVDHWRLFTEKLIEFMFDSFVFPRIWRKCCEGGTWSTWTSNDA